MKVKLGLNVSTMNQRNTWGKTNITTLTNTLFNSNPLNKTNSILRNLNPLHKKNIKTNMKTKPITTTNAYLDDDTVKILFSITDGIRRGIGVFFLYSAIKSFMTIKEIDDTMDYYNIDRDEDNDEIEEKLKNKKLNNKNKK